MQLAESCFLTHIRLPLHKTPKMIALNSFLLLCSSANLGAIIHKGDSLIIHTYGFSTRQPVARLWASHVLGTDLTTMIAGGYSTNGTMHTSDTEALNSNSLTFDANKPSGSGMEENFSRVNRICIDYGPRLFGVARSDYFNLVRPYGTVVNDGNLTDISCKLLKLASQFGASEAVIGVPLDSNGIMSHTVRNINGQICLNFSRVFSSVASHRYSNSSFRTVLFDERYSTREATWRIQTDRIKGLGIYFSPLVEPHV